MAQRIEAQIGDTPRTILKAYATALGLRDEQARPVPGWPAYVTVVAKEAWVEMPIPGTNWMAAARLLEHAGAAVIGELRVYPAERSPHRLAGQWNAWVGGIRASCPPSGVTVDVLRALPLRRFSKANRSFLTNLYHTAPERLAELGFVAGPRQQRRRIDDHALAALANLYQKTIESGSRQVVKDMATTLELHGAEARLRDLVFLARERKILGGPRKQGKAGGELTGYGKSLLAAVEAAEGPKGVSGGARKATATKDNPKKPRRKER